MATETVCAKCGGSGFIIVEGATVSSARRCDCALQGRAVRMEDRAQIPPLYRNASFDNFLLPEGNPVARSALSRVMIAVQAFVRDFPHETRPGLLLVGDSGTGKTHLAVAALRRIIEKGFECLFWDYQHLLDRIFAGYDANSNSSDKQAYQLALDTEVLLLDDLGSQRGSDWVEDTVTRIITWRCNNRKPVIATTNLPDVAAGSTMVQRNELLNKVEHRRTLAEQIGTRARSRLFEMCTVIQMPAIEDYRVQLQKSRKY